MQVMDPPTTLFVAFSMTHDLFDPDPNLTCLQLQSLRVICPNKEGRAPPRSGGDNRFFNRIVGAHSEEYGAGIDELDERWVRDHPNLVGDFIGEPWHFLWLPMVH